MCVTSMATGIVGITLTGKLLEGIALQMLCQTGASPFFPVSVNVRNYIIIHPIHKTPLHSD